MMMKWLRTFASETHADERRARRWHLLQAVTYGMLIGEYLVAIAWHCTAARRHRIAADHKPPAHGVWDETDPDGG